MIRLGNNEVLKTLKKTLTFVDTAAAVNADAEDSTIALRETEYQTVKILMSGSL